MIGMPTRLLSLSQRARGGNSFIRTVFGFGALNSVPAQAPGGARYARMKVAGRGGLYYYEDTRGSVPYNFYHFGGTGAYSRAVVPLAPGDILQVSSNYAFNSTAGTAILRNGVVVLFAENGTDGGSASANAASGLAAGGRTTMGVGDYLGVAGQTYAAGDGGLTAQTTVAQTDASEPDNSLFALGSLSVAAPGSAPGTVTPNFISSAFTIEFFSSDPRLA